MTLISSPAPGSGLLDRLAAGAWLTPGRIGAWASGLVALYLVTLTAWALTGSWFVDAAGALTPTDFVSFWSAGHLALEGKADTAYDFATLQAVHALALGHPVIPQYYWFYPPIFLLLVAPLALLPYVLALLVWVGCTLALYLGALRRIFPHRLTVVAALAAPTACANLITAQNGFLTAALLGGGLVCLETQPLLAGFLLGLLSIKPQLALLIPVVLLGAGRFRVAAAAAVTVVALAALSTAALGLDSWSAFLGAPHHANATLLQHSTVGLYKIQSVYAALRVLGVDSSLAAAGQALASLAVATIVLRLWRHSLPYALKAAALAAGTLLVTPYAMIYDLALLAVAMAFLARDGAAAGFRPWEKPSMVAVALLPILFPWISAIGLVTEVAVLALVLRRAAPAEAPI